MEPLNLIDALSGAVPCKACCTLTMKKLCKSLYETTPHKPLLIEIMNRSLRDLEHNYEVNCTIVAARLRKLNQNCVVLPQVCGMHRFTRQQAFIPLPSAPIPLAYRGFDIDWQKFV